MSYEEEDLLNSGFSIDDEFDPIDEDGDLAADFKEDFEDTDPDDGFH